MTIDTPSAAQLPALRRLWQQAFGDSDAFLDAFFSQGFSPARCRCAVQNGQLAAALYWFDCRCREQRLAYLYAVATDLSCRGRGVAHALMADTHAHLARLGYGGTVLVPGSESLFRFYETMGYRPFGGIRAYTCKPGGTPVTLRRLDASEYARLRSDLLPADSVVQEGETLAFLQTQAEFYAGADVVLCAIREADRLFIPELLGNPDRVPGILTALSAAEGSFRTPGTDKPFAMYRPISCAVPPAYFGLALD